MLTGVFDNLFLEDNNVEKEDKSMRFNVNVSGAAKENVSVNKDVFQTLDHRPIDSADALEEKR